MTLYRIRVYHNADAPFIAYRDGHRLVAAISYNIMLPPDRDPQQIADWTFATLNADLEYLERYRDAGGEATFLMACVYRLLRRRSMSQGDVINVATDSASEWLACDQLGWIRIAAPDGLDEHPLTAETIYQHIRAQTP